MAVQIKNTLSFVGLAAGASIVLPHGLNNGSRALAPDIVFLPSSDLTVVTDDVNVTLTNAGAAALSGDVLVEWWHTIERAFGGVQNVDLPIKPFVVVGTARSSGPVGAFVYRPGAVGADAPGGNVYTDWTLLMAALDATKPLGLRILEFDTAFMNPAPIPAGVWNMTDVRWVNGPVQTEVEFINGAQIVLDPPTVAGPYRLTIDGSGVFVFRYDGVGPDVPFDGVDILCAGQSVLFGNTNPAAAPMFRVQGFNRLVLSGAGALSGYGDYPSSTLAAPIIDLNGGELFIFGGAGNIANGFATDLSGGPGGSVFALLYDSFVGDLDAGLRDQWNAPALFAAGGSVFFDFIADSNRYRVDPFFIGFPIVPATSPYDGSYNEFIPVDTTLGVVTINLPSAQRSFGERVTIKDVGGAALANNITVASTYGDTIEDGVIATNNGAKTWACWGPGLWSVISQY